MGLTFANTLLLSNAAVSLGGAFVSLEISMGLLIFFSLFSFILAWTFISLQIKEFLIMGFFFLDSVYSSVFFFLTGLHFFHLFLGLLLISLLFHSCSFSFQNPDIFNTRFFLSLSFSKCISFLLYLYFIILFVSYLSLSFGILFDLYLGL